MRYIRRKLGVVVEEIEEKNNKEWKEHVIKISPFRYSRQAVFHKHDGKQDLGPPKKRVEGPSNLTSKRVVGPSLDGKNFHLKRF